MMTNMMIYMMRMMRMMRTTRMRVMMMMMCRRAFAMHTMRILYLSTLDGRLKWTNGGDLDTAL